jgi:hypothetical protein
MLAGPIDVLTGDYLAELTMLILWKAKQKDDSSGYATTFLRQLEEVLEDCLDRGIKIVVNAGGLNPAGLADRVRQLAARLGLTVQVGYITGDDLLPRIGELQAAGSGSTGAVGCAAQEPRPAPPRAPVAGSRRRSSAEMACSRQNVLTAPRGASGGHCAIARRTRGSTGSKRAMPQTSRRSVTTKGPRSGTDLLMQKRHRCPDT